MNPDRWMRGLPSTAPAPVTAPRRVERHDTSAGHAHSPAVSAAWTDLRQGSRTEP